MKFFFTIFGILCSLLVFSQNTTINGFVYDAESGEKLINATIYDDLGETVFTNEYGYYSFTFKPQSDTITLNTAMLGYVQTSKKIDVKTTEQVNFYLKSNTKIDSVIVTGRQPITRTTETDVVEIPISQINLMPALGAESDIFKSLQLMPGIQSGSEGTSNLYVRGGSLDENLILLDDVPLYYINHLSGFISVFNTDAISSVKMFKGGFPARYGSRLSSVIDVRMKEGDMKKYHGKFVVGIINTKILYEGPIIKDKMSFMISARMLPINLIIKPLSLLNPEGQMIGYNFHDINAKINYKLNSKNHFYLSLYTGDDKLSLNISKLRDKNQILRYKLVWGNRFVAFRWNHIFTKKLFLNTTLSYSRFRYNNLLKSKSLSEQKTLTYNFRTGIQDFTLKSVFNYNILRQYKINFGINSIYHTFNPGVTYYKTTASDTIQSDVKSGIEQFSGLENILFIENKLTFSSFFRANIGFHFSNYYLQKENYQSFEPRIVLNFIPFKNLAFKASYSEMKQYINLLTSNAIGLTPDIWVSANSEIPPSDSKQASVGIFFHSKPKDIEISIISYYKISDKLIAYKEGAVFKGNAEKWRDKIEINGNGKSYGIELLIQKKQGKTTGWIAYTYAKTTRQFANINSGLEYPFKYDRRHDFSIVFNQKINEKISLSANWIFGSGYPYTMPIAAYNVVDDGTMRQEQPQLTDGREIYIYADRNNYRMRTYHRLDVAANFSKKVKKGVRTWTISIYNLYNRRNPYFYFIKQEPNDKKYHLIQQSLFPIIPSVSYSLKF